MILRKYSGNFISYIYFIYIRYKHGEYNGQYKFHAKFESFIKKIRFWPDADWTNICCAKKC